MHIVYFHPDKYNGYGATQVGRLLERLKEQKLDVTKGRIIEQGLTLEEASDRERELQIRDGYPPDESTYTHVRHMQKLSLNPESRKKMVANTDYKARGIIISKALKGRPSHPNSHSAEANLKRSLALKGRPSHPNCHSPEVNLKRSLASKGKIQHQMLTPEAINKRAVKRRKPVIQMTKQGKYIKKWNSIKEAANANNTHLAQISMCISKKSNVKSAGGFKWKFAQ